MWFHLSEHYCLFSGTNRAPNTVHVGSNALPPQSCSQYSPCIGSSALARALPPPIVIPGKQSIGEKTIMGPFSPKILDGVEKSFQFC